MLILRCSRPPVTMAPKANVPSTSDGSGTVAPRDGGIANVAESEIDVPVCVKLMANDAGVGVGPTRPPLALPKT